MSAVANNDYLTALPNGFDGFELREYISRSDQRDRLVKKYAWAIPTDEALDAILDESKVIVEIGAGRGYWAHLLDERGATVHAYDNGSWVLHSEVQPWFDVRCGGPEMVERHPDAAAFICWPPYDTPMAFEVATRVVAGGSLIYIGEGHGGCNADDEFWDLMDDQVPEKRSVNLPQWWGLHDALTIFERSTR